MCCEELQGVINAAAAQVNCALMPTSLIKLLDSTRTSASQRSSPGPAEPRTLDYKLQDHMYSFHQAQDPLLSVDMGLLGVGPVREPSGAFTT